jgi:solute carrier family 38 (sodium-coupled neutral amino acid transporter), member 2
MVLLATGFFGFLLFGDD